MMTSRAARSTLFLLAGLLAGGCHRSSAPAAATPAAPASAPPPAWLGAYDAEQLKVLALAPEAPVEVPAPKVYPDLSRFTFTGESPAKVPSDLLGYADLVSQVLSQSSYLYVFRTGPSSLANTTALFGPAPADEADAWKRVVASDSGQLSLQPALPDEPARAEVDRARGLAPAEAFEALTKAAPNAGPCPAVHGMMGDLALTTGNLDAAEAAAQQALKIDPRFPAAHRILAEVSLRRGDQAKARSSIAEALALYPASKRAWLVAEAVVGREIVRTIGTPMPMIEVGTSGAIVVIACETPLCERYAGCKAAMRYEPGLREAVLKEKAEVPYHLSATEEVVCLEAGLGAHLQARRDPGRPPAPDPNAELLLRLAQSRGLTAYAMFEIIGVHAPDWLRVAPAPVHDAVVAYVTSRVFGAPTEGAPASSSSVVTAGLTAAPGGVRVR